MCKKLKALLKMVKVLNMTQIFLPNSPLGAGKQKPTLGYFIFANDTVMSHTVLVTDSIPDPLDLWTLNIVVIAQISHM